MSNRSAVLALVIFFGMAGSAIAQNGLRVGYDTPFVPGEPFSAEKIPVRADARRLSESIDRYAGAPLPKALAVSEDGLHAIGVWPDPNRPPRTSADTKRMALQHCEFRAGLPCKLVAVDGNLAKSDPPVVESLPKSGRFSPDRMPFWSAASVDGAQSLSAYAAHPGPKALVIAPLDKASHAWAAATSLDEAREKALADCAKRIKTAGVKCVVFAEGDEFVYGAPNGKRQLASGKAIVPKEVTVLYVGAYDCPPCGFWERVRKPAFLESAEAKQVNYREVKSGSYRSTMREADWPQDVRWIRELGAAQAGTPRFIVAVDGKIVRNVRGVGNWDTDALPLIQRLAASKARGA